VAKDGEAGDITILHSAEVEGDRGCRFWPDDATSDRDFFRLAGERHLLRELYGHLMS
jgi:hypothetical protein